jgi:hypothetical protein
LNKVIDIAQQSSIKPIKIITGAAEILVSQRELREKYETNRDIKYWSTYFLLKSLTSSGVICQWTKQKESLLDFCKMTENTFRNHLSKLKELKLIKVTKNRTILLTSFETAADILGISFTGHTIIDYDTSTQGNQIFQYLLRGEEIRSNQAKQSKTLWYYVGKNPLLKDALFTLLVKDGADKKLLEKDITYFQEQLLLLQQQAFKDGSPLLDILTTCRADINRGVKRIQEYHTYKSKQSVSYMKGRMVELQVITVTKVCIKSKERSRLYIPIDGSNASRASDHPAAKKRHRDGYKYLPATKETAWFLTDQVTHNYKSQNQQKNEKKKVAA